MSSSRTRSDGAVALWALDGDRLDAEESNLIVRVEDGALAGVVEAADDGETVPLDLYAEYESSEYDHVYFERSRLNADVEAVVRRRDRAAPVGK